MTDEPPAKPDDPGQQAGGPQEAGSEQVRVPVGGIAPEVSRRVSSILDAVEREADRLRSDAEEEASRYLDYSRRRADELVAERQRRIGELSDEIMAKAEAVIGRLDDAAPVRQGFESLVRSLGEAAERLSQEAQHTRPDFEPPSFHDEAVQAPPPAPRQPVQGEPGPTGQQAPAYGYEPQRPPSVPQQDPAHGYEPQQPPSVPQPPPGDPRARPPGSGGDQPEPASPAPGADLGRAPSAAHSPAAPGRAVGGQAPPIDDAKLIAIQMAAAGNTRRQVREHLQNAIGVGDARSVLDEVFGAGSAEDARVPWTAFPR